MADPDEVMSVLRQCHEAVGELIRRFDVRLERFTGDGFMVFFNDPLPCPDPAGRAVAMGIAIRDRVRELSGGWRKRGYQWDFGAGIALGYATLGKIGFEGRFDYAAIGKVTNLAARLCGEAQGGQVLSSQHMHAAVEELVEAEPAGELSLRGFLSTVPAFNVLRLREGAA